MVVVVEEVDASAERREVGYTVEDEEVVVDTIHADVAVADIIRTRLIIFDKALMFYLSFYIIDNKPSLSLLVCSIPWQCG